jgi:hypothetical protein
MSLSSISIWNSMPEVELEPVPKAMAPTPSVRVIVLS